MTHQTYLTTIGGPWPQIGNHCKKTKHIIRNTNRSVFYIFILSIKLKIVYQKIHENQPTASRAATLMKLHFICSWIFTAMFLFLHTGHLNLPASKWAQWPIKWGMSSRCSPLIADHSPHCPNWHATLNLIGIFYLLPCKQVFLSYLLPIRIKRRSPSAVVVMSPMQIEYPKCFMLKWKRPRGCGERDNLRAEISTFGASLFTLIVHLFGWSNRPLGRRI